MVGDFLWFVLLGEGLAKWYFVVWEGGNLFLVWVFYLGDFWVGVGFVVAEWVFLFGFL
jgi:hypothetical protein